MRQSVYVVVKPALAAGIFTQDRGQVGYGFTITLDVEMKTGHIFLGPKIVVITHCPYSERAPAKPPKLLGHPEKASRVFVRSQGKSIADDVNSEIFQSEDCGSVERMRGCNPDIGR